MLCKSIPTVLATLVSLAACTYPTISGQQYALILRYTKYAAASYADACPVPPNNSTVVQYFSDAATDTQATLFRDDTNKELVIAFRGTSTPQDFVTDSEQTLVALTSVGTSGCTGCFVDQGVQTSWDSVSAPIIAAIQAQQSAHQNYNLTVTGHSLGGALASIASASLYGVGFKFVSYTFGQFRTGNPTYANYIDSILPPPTFRRVTHTNDGVPQTVLRAQGYKHHATEFWELEPFGPGNTQQCNGQDVPDCNNSEPGYGIGFSGRGINAAHLCYTGILIGNPVDRGASVCGAPSPLPSTCSTATGGGIIKRDEVVM